jgi:hypothetical protein
LFASLYSPWPGCAFVVNISSSSSKMWILSRILVLGINAKRSLHRFM